MKEVKILTQNVSMLNNTQQTLSVLEKKLEEKLNEGFEMKLSNMLPYPGGYTLYIILERVV